MNDEPLDYVCGSIRVVSPRWDCFIDRMIAETDWSTWYCDIAWLV
jgi:hypothetical protein